MSNTDTLLEFLQIPICSSEGIFERFQEIPNSIFRGQNKERFLYCRGFRKNRVLLVAHADTVWDEFYLKGIRFHQELAFRDKIIESGRQDCGIGADDRAGCAILWLLKDMGHSLLITDGEEKGLQGSTWLMHHPDNSDIADEINEEHQFVVQFDRCNGRDFKCYKVGTPEFKAYIERITGYNDVGQDRSTDISKLCRSIVGVNLSIGYHNEHNCYSEDGKNEFLNVAEWEYTLQLCREWLSQNGLPRFSLV